MCSTLGKWNLFLHFSVGAITLRFTIRSELLWDRCTQATALCTCVNPASYCVCQLHYFNIHMTLCASTPIYSNHYICVAWTHNIILLNVVIPNTVYIPYMCYSHTLATLFCTCHFHSSPIITMHVLIPLLVCVKPYVSLPHPTHIPFYVLCHPNSILWQQNAFLSHHWHHKTM